MKIVLMVTIVTQTWFNQHAMTLMSVILAIQFSMAQVTVVLRLCVPTLLVVCHAHVTQGSLNMWHGQGVGTSMSVLRVAVSARQTLIVGTCMDHTIVPAW